MKWYLVKVIMGQEAEQLSFDFMRIRHNHTIHYRGESPEDVIERLRATIGREEDIRFEVIGESNFGKKKRL